MTQEDIDLSPKVQVQFTKSSSKDGGEGYTIRVAEGADEVEARRVMELARRMRRDAEDEIKGPSLTEKLEESMK